MAAQAHTAAGKVEVIWPGQSSFKSTSPGGEIIFTDPWLRTNPITPPEYKKLKVFMQGDPDALRHPPAGQRHGPGVQRRKGSHSAAKAFIAVPGQPLRNGPRVGFL